MVAPENQIVAWRRMKQEQHRFSSSPPKLPQKVESPPKEEDAAVQEANAEADRKRKLARGYRGTVLRDMVAPDNAAGGGTPELKGTFGA